MQELVEEKNLTREEETRDCAMLGLIKPLPCQYQAPPCLYPHHLIKYKYRRSKQLISLVWYDLWQNYSAKAWCPILKVKFFVGTFWPSSPFTITITNRKDKWEKGKNYCYFVCCIWFNQGWGLNVRKTTKPSKLNKHDNRPNSLYYIYEPSELPFSRIEPHEEIFQHGFPPFIEILTEVPLEGWERWAWFCVFLLPLIRTLEHL